ncbi:LysR family transcriptional regulator [Enemella evansiae]|uniref:LysR family transcriptional regulator n=1 Tax=Enemella evansiae TaxID=2016499 RepID=UPI0015957ED2|nr:LysR family transcriptional regulator [Enemella evansiae]
MSRPPVSADDLLVLLTVARLGRYSAAADVLGVNHTTVSRRIGGLEKALGARVLVQTSDGWELTEAGRSILGAAETVERAVKSLTDRGDSPEGLSGVVRLATPDGFGTHFAVPALVRLREQHPQLQTELITATQRLKQHRSGVDIEVIVGEPKVHRAVAVQLCGYHLGLYATADYLRRNGEPTSLADLAEHCVVYYIEQSLQVDELDLATERLPAPRQAMRSTSVFVHVETTLASAGIGILPDFMADPEPRLVRVLADEYAHPADYWAVIREESLRNPAVGVTMDALRAAVGGV